MFGGLFAFRRRHGDDMRRLGAEKTTTVTVLNSRTASEPSTSPWSPVVLCEIFCSRFRLIGIQLLVVSQVATNRDR